MRFLRSLKSAVSSHKNYDLRTPQEIHKEAEGYSPIGAQELVDRRRVDLHPQELRSHDGQDKANHRVLHRA